MTKRFLVTLELDPDNPYNLQETADEIKSNLESCMDELGILSVNVEETLYIEPSIYSYEDD